MAIVERKLYNSKFWGRSGITHPKTMSSPYLTGSLSSGKTPSWGCELEPRGGEGWLLLQDGRSSRDGGGHRDSELPSKTMPTGHEWGSLLKEETASRNDWL